MKGRAIDRDPGGRCYEIDMRSDITLRDYFAAAALPAVIAAYNELNLPAIGTDHILRNCPIIVYRFADAMLAAREEAPK